MIVVIFRSKVREGVEEEYYARADEMAAIARTMPGFISFKAYTADDGERISVHEWESREQLEAWRTHPEHLEMQQYGRDKFYDEYTLYVMESPRESRFRRSQVDAWTRERVER